MRRLSELIPPAPARGRRNTLTRDDLPALAVVAALSAIAATLAGCHPTGNPIGDALVTGGIAFGVSWLAATAPWWTLVVAGGAAVLAGGAWLPVGLGVAGALLGLYVGDRSDSLPALRGLSAALTVQGLLRLEFDPFFAASALVAGSAIALLAGTGLQRRRRYIRRRFLRGAAIGLGTAALFTVVFLLSALVSRDDLTDGYRGLLDGLGQLQSGDPQAAALTLHLAATSLAAAGDGLDAPWNEPARLVPLVAQHQQALSSIIVQAAASAEAAADALDVVDFDALTIENGRIDVESVAILERPLADLEAAVGALHEALVQSDSPWLAGPIAERLDRYLGRAADAHRQATAIHRAAALGPAMLGADGPRRYFVGFASPAEARGLVGLMGNYAVLEVDGGLIRRTGFGRINELGNQLEAAGPVWIDAPDEYFARYGQYGAGGLQAEGGEPVNRSYLSNVTMNPDMPSAARVITQLWAAAGNEPVDGVIIMDPAAIAGLLAATGPIQVEGRDEPLTATTVEKFLLLDQYALDTPERRDLLEDVATATLDAVLDGALPPPQRLSQLLGPPAAEGHLLVWTPDPAEQELLRLIGVDGRLPELDGADGLAVLNDNAIANKIDTFLERDVEYLADYDSGTGAVTGTVTITLRNTAPADGYPDYVLRSEFIDLPPGTNRTLLTLLSPLDATAATVDGAATGFRVTTQQGWQATTFELDLAPGQERVIVLELSGRVAPGGYRLVVRPQPLFRDDGIDILVGGDTDVRLSGVLTRRLELTASGARAFR